jgi:LysM repeat protein
VPAIHAAAVAALTAAGLAIAPAADVTWSTTTTESAPGWTTTVVAPAQRAPRPATRTRRHHTPQTWHAATTCRPLDDDTWRVRHGDTLWLVAGCTDTTVRQVAAASGINPAAVLHVGQTLVIPPAVTR